MFLDLPLGLHISAADTCRSVLSEVLVSCSIQHPVSIPVSHHWALLASLDYRPSPLLLYALYAWMYFFLTRTHLTLFFYLLSVWEIVGQQGGGLSVLRTFRLMRVLKLVRFMPALQRQLVVLMKTMDNVATFCMLLMLFIFIFRWVLKWAPSFLFEACCVCALRLNWPILIYVPWQNSTSC